VEIGGVSGTVKELTIMRTSLDAPDNRLILIPNADVAAAKITNFSTEPLRRVDLQFTASYDAPTELVKQALLEVIRADFVSTAKSKGISQRDVIWKHALPNALIPIITVIGGSFGMMLGGATITESIFSIPGIGLYMMSGINNRDYPVVRGCIIYIAFMFAVMMLLTDLIYAFVDPRIKAQYVRAKKQPEKTADTERE